MRRGFFSVNSYDVSIRGVIFGLLFVEFVSGSIQGLYLPLFDIIAERTNVTSSEITWFVAVQTLSAAIAVPLLAKLGDRYGHRRVLLVCIACVAISVLTVALTTNLLVVLVGRVLAGPLSVWLALEVAIVNGLGDASASLRRRAVGWLVSSLTLGIVFGSIVSGIAASVLPVVWVLLLPMPLCVLCFIAVFVRVPSTTADDKSSVDWFGFLLLGVIVLSLMLLMSYISSVNFSVGLVALGLFLIIVLCVVFVKWERLFASPAVDLSMLIKSALGPLYLASVAFGMVLYGTQTVTTTFLSADPAVSGIGFGYPSSIVGLITGGFSLFAAVGSILYAAGARTITDRGMLVLGFCVVSLGCVFLAAFGQDSITSVVSIVLLMGTGCGVLLGGFPTLVSLHSDPGTFAVATGIYSTSKTVGGSFAGAFFGFLLSKSAGSGSHAGYTSVWLTCAALMLGSALLLWGGMRAYSGHELSKIGINQTE